MEEHWVKTATDEEIIEALREIDDSDEIRTTPKESQLIESVVFKQKTWLSEAQKAWAQDVIQKYLD